MEKTTKMSLKEELQALLDNVDENKLMEQLIPRIYTSCRYGFLIKYHLTICQKDPEPNLYDELKKRGYKEIAPQYLTTCYLCKIDDTTTKYYIIEISAERIQFYISPVEIRSYILTPITKRPKELFGMINTKDMPAATIIDWVQIMEKSAITMEKQ